MNVSRNAALIQEQWAGYGAYSAHELYAEHFVYFDTKLEGLKHASPLYRLTLGRILSAYWNYMRSMALDGFLYEVDTHNIDVQSPEIPPVLKKRLRVY